MNLIFRILIVLLTSFFKERLPIDSASSSLSLITLPTDLDINWHMNNGRFLTLCDLNRVDLFIRTGLFRLIRRKKWVPMIIENTMHYRKPLKLFQRFEVSTTLTHWDKKAFYMVHEFKTAGEIIATGTSKGVLRGKQGIVSSEDVFKQLKPSEQGG